MKLVYWNKLSKKVHDCNTGFKQNNLLCIILLGPPEKLVVTPALPEVTIENGNPLQFNVQVQDKAGNITVNPRLNVVCKVSDQF
jgi:hypothetical protein